MNTVVNSQSNEAAPNGDPAVAKLALRWKSAIKKAAAQTSLEAAALPQFDVEQMPASSPDHTTVHARLASRSTAIKNVPSPEWRAVSPLQLRKVDRRLAQMQQAWLAPSINGHFELNGELIDWRLTLPQPVANPVVALIDHQPMMVEESVELSTDDGAAAMVSPDVAVQATSFSLTVGAESFLLNWIAAPWHSLGADAKHALLLVAVSPIVENLGFAFGDHWQVTGLADRTEERRDERHESGAKISMGISFSHAGVAFFDTANLIVPEKWLERFLQTRREASSSFSLKSLLLSHPQLSEMQHTLPVIVGELSLPARSVQELDLGDVIFFATHYGALADVWRSNEVKARIDAPSASFGLTLDSAAQMATIRSISLHQSGAQSRPFPGINTAAAPHFSSSHKIDPTDMKNTTLPDELATGAATMADHLATLPIAITIEVAELSLPLSALADIAIGTTLALAKPLNEHLLTIRANGHAIAFGELVMLDNEVGVLVKRLASTSPSRRDVDEVGDVNSGIEIAPSETSGDMPTAVDESHPSESSVSS